MATSPEIVYTITPEGYTALRVSDKLLTLELRTVLTMVDGLCPVAQYIPFMRALSPMLPKFDALEQAGYIRRTGSVSSMAVDAFVKALAAGVKLSELPSIDARSDVSGFAPLV
jgi:hypothetical protein